MKPVYHLVIILLLWLVLSLCTCHPVLDGYHRSNNVQCIDSERDALLKFKHGITVDHCRQLTSWRSYTNCCRWHGVVCSNLTSHVIKLGLASSDDGSCQLEGKVSPSLGELKHLEHLNLSNNFFYGEIPYQLGNLSKLTTLDLYHAYNNVPAQSLSWISRLTLLRYLDLSGANFSKVGNWITIVNNLSSLRVLSMKACELSSELPSSISYVNTSATLQSISLSGNNFVGNSLFRWLFNLPRITSQLVHLDLSSNSFVGPIPSEIGNLHSLSYLDLSVNEMVGSIPSEIGNLHSLSYLDLSVNELMDSIPSEIENLHSLSYLDLSSNFLKSSIPSKIWNLHSLSHLDLSYNSFTGLIPSEIGNLHSLSYLDLSLNDFQGLVPSEIGKLHSLSYLDLSYNAIQGSVFKIISKLCNLEQLQLGNNNFTDELSNIIHSLVNCNNKALLVLDLSSNCFWGGIPDDIGTLSSLRELSLGSNQLKGEISPGIRQLTMLEILDVSSNSLEGTLTRTFFLGFVSLRQLSLSDNLRLEINTEEDWIPPFKLHIIRLRSCKLGSRFPKWLQLQTNLSYFDVSNTGLSDSIHVSFWNSLSPNLLYLNMSNNQLYGMLPNLPQWRKPFFSNPFALIDLSSNLFNGVVPSAFANTWSLYLNGNRFSNCSNILCPKTESMLVDLDLSNNLLSGELPDCWVNFKQLESLHLENNKFSGSMPKSISTLSGLKYLDLYNNSFSGRFPVSCENLTLLVILNLGYNSFSGNIPSWIGNTFPSLGALILRKNLFTGEIPESICQLKSSQILDLAINHLSGVLPHCIRKFTQMKGTKNLQLNSKLDVKQHRSENGTETRIETVIVSWKREEQRFKETIRFVKYIDLSNNELTGEIPDGITTLNGLESLDLSNNKLSGNIPFEIGNLKALELLDLSNNHLSGEIPISLAKVTTLGIVNVSNNNLSGEIPASTQLQSFDKSSYTGNPRLCGAPLPSCSKDREPFNIPNGHITSVQNKDDDFGFFLGLYISVVLGFIVGFWGVCGTLVIKTSWRHAYFRLLDNIKDKIM